MIQEKFSKAVYQLLQTEPYYANFILNCIVNLNDKKCPTASACLTEKGVVLSFNEKFMNQFEQPQFIGILKHEILHVLFEHINLMATVQENHRIWNIAMDLCINQYINNLPAECVTLPGVIKETGLDLLPFETSEYYYNKLLTKAQEIKASGMKEIDEHKGSTIKEMYSKIKIKEVSDKAIKQSAGNVPQELMKVIGGLNEEAKVCWQQILKNFLARSTSRFTKNTTKKTNRRFGITQPGKKKLRKLTVGCCIDTSGSMSDSQIDSVLNEVGSIVNYADVHLVYADAEVQNVVSIKQKKAFTKERHGCGGTYYQPAIDKCKELNCDVIMYMGDMDCADTPTNPGTPFLWITVGSDKRPGEFGNIIKID